MFNRLFSTVLGRRRIKSQAELKKKTTYKNGGASYVRQGVRASVYCGPKNFDGDAPETITISADNLVVVKPKEG